MTLGGGCLGIFHGEQRRHGAPTICLVGAGVTGLWDEVPGRAEVSSPRCGSLDLHIVLCLIKRMNEYIKYSWGQKLYCLCLFLCVYIYVCRLIKLCRGWRWVCPRPLRSQVGAGSSGKSGGLGGKLSVRELALVDVSLAH